MDETAKVENAGDLSIYLLPLGFNDPSLLGDIGAAVEKMFGTAIGQLPPLPVPEFAHNKSRGQYHSTAILRSLGSRIPADALRLLAIADVDLFVPQLNFVFGEAAVGGKVCIISLYRLHPEFYGQPPDRQLFVERAVKEAIHELGHTFGLRHCQDPGCVMYFSNNIEDTDRKSREFRKECAEKLRSGLKRIKSAA